MYRRKPKQRQGIVEASAVEVGDMDGKGGRQRREKVGMTELNKRIEAIHLRRLP